MAYKIKMKSMVFAVLVFAPALSANYSMQIVQRHYGEGINATVKKVLEQALGEYSERLRENLVPAQLRLKEKKKGSDQVVAKSRSQIDAIYSAFNTDREQNTYTLERLMALGKQNIAAQASIRQVEAYRKLLLPESQTLEASSSSWSKETFCAQDFSQLYKKEEFAYPAWEEILNPLTHNPEKRGYGVKSSHEQGDDLMNITALVRRVIGAFLCVYGTPMTLIAGVMLGKASNDDISAITSSFYHSIQEKEQQKREMEETKNWIQTHPITPKLIGERTQEICRADLNWDAIMGPILAERAYLMAEWKQTHQSLANDIATFHQDEENLKKNIQQYEILHQKASLESIWFPLIRRKFTENEEGWVMDYIHHIRPLEEEIFSCIKKYHLPCHEGMLCIHQLEKKAKEKFKEMRRQWWGDNPPSINFLITGKEQVFLEDLQDYAQTFPSICEGMKRSSIQKAKI